MRLKNKKNTTVKTAKQKNILKVTKIFIKKRKEEKWNIDKKVFLEDTNNHSGRAIGWKLASTRKDILFGARWKTNK